jgi:transcriptional regulator of heat shock response
VPELKLNPTEALLLALVGQEEGRLHSQIARLQQDIRANRIAAISNIFKTREEKLELDPLAVEIEVDDDGRPVKLTWKKPT